MSHEVLGLVLLGVLFVVILGGFPISFTLIFLGMVFGYIGLGNRVFVLHDVHDDAPPAQAQDDRFGHVRCLRWRDPPCHTGGTPARDLATCTARTTTEPCGFPPPAWCR